MSSENIDDILDGALQDVSKKRDLEDGEEVASKRLKLEDQDPLELVFDDLPPLDVSNPPSLSPHLDLLEVNSVSPVLKKTEVKQETRSSATPTPIAQTTTASNTATPTSVPVVAPLVPLAVPLTTPLKKTLKSTTKKSSVTNNTTGAGPPKDQTNDPDKLSDAILAAGIDLRAEESLLAIANQNKVSTSVQHQVLTPARIHDLKQFGGFMNKVMKENDMKQLSPAKMEIVELVQLACNHFLTDIVTNSVVYSRHRRRLLKTKVKSSSTQRSDISRALRDLAVKDKEAEEQRMKKRVLLGMDDGDDKVEKAGAEETLHRAANATAAMMMAGSKKKKYSWMTGSSNGNGSPGFTASNGSTNSAIATRGDTGIRYRETREEPGIALRDLVAALEIRRMGVKRTLTKAYSKL